MVLKLQAGDGMRDSTGFEAYNRPEFSEVMRY